MTSRTKLTRKQVDDVLGGDETWKHADSTTGVQTRLSDSFEPPWLTRPSKATCPKCDNGRAYFYQLQIRSADEPMTTCESSKPFRPCTITIKRVTPGSPSLLQFIGERR
jgi:DNA-directed RNA polymerase subunit M/transcription elongation factor TFIIS